MQEEEINLFIDLCDRYILLGQGGRIRLKEIISGDDISKHPPQILKEISLWLQEVSPLLRDSRVAVNIVDDIEMFLFGLYSEDKGDDPY